MMGFYEFQKDLIAGVQKNLEDAAKGISKEVYEAQKEVLKNAQDSLERTGKAALLNAVAEVKKEARITAEKFFDKVIAGLKKGNMLEKTAAFLLGLVRDKALILMSEK